MELTSYIYGLLFLIVVILAIFVFLWTRNVFKSTVASLSSSFAGFLIGANGGGPHCLDSLMGGISSESFGFFLVKHQAASANG